MFFHVIIRIALWPKYYYYPNFTVGVCWFSVCAPPYPPYDTTLEGWSVGLLQLCSFVLWIPVRLVSEPLGDGESSHNIIGGDGLSFLPEVSAPGKWPCPPASGLTWFWPHYFPSPFMAQADDGFLLLPALGYFPKPCWSLLVVLIKFSLMVSLECALYFISGPWILQNGALAQND